jgi:hypothetical protein
MTQKSYDFETNNLVDEPAVDPGVVADRIYGRLGATFPIKWVGRDNAVPIVDTDDLPEGVTESELENAIQNSHPRADGKLI